ncbi:MULTISPECIES: hypothetical protein, partial [Streptomyces]
MIGFNTRVERDGQVGIGPTVHSVLAVFCFKGTSTNRNRLDGVSTNLALIFGTLLSSQGADASF